MAVATAPHSGGVSDRRASVAHCGWLQMGDPAAPREKASDQQLQKVPSARTIARLMTIARDHLSKADTVTVAAIEAGVPTLVDARKLIDRFHTMVRKRIEADLDPWIEAASQSLVASFASGVSKDKASVHAALVQPWSNGQTEGHTISISERLENVGERGDGFYGFGIAFDAEDRLLDWRARRRLI